MIESLFWKVAAPILIAATGYGFVAPPLISSSSDAGFFGGIGVLILTTFGVVSTGWIAYKAIRRAVK